MNEEEEYSAMPIYETSSKTARARTEAAASAVAAKEKEVERRTSTRKQIRPFTNQDDGLSKGRSRKKKKTARRVKKSCSVDGCTKYAQNGGVCVRHGAKVKLCSSEGCTNQVKKGGVCIRHGATEKRCSSVGCTNRAVKGGVCVKHGAKIDYKRCSWEGCTKYAVKGGVCVRHGAKVKLCSSVGCTNIVVEGGVCKKHGAKVKRYSGESQSRGKDAAEKKGKSSVSKDQLKSSKRKRKSLEEDQPAGEEVIKKKHRYEYSVDGCTTYARKGVVYMSNAAKVNQCRRKGCTKKAESGGVCKDCKWQEVTVSFSRNGHTSIIQNGQVDENSSLPSEDSSTDAHDQHDDSISRSDQEVEIDNSSSDDSSSDDSSSDDDDDSAEFDANKSQEQGGREGG